MRNDELVALQGKVTELARRYGLRHVSTYVSSSEWSAVPLVGAYGLEKFESGGGTVYTEGESFESVLRVLEHKLIAKRMSEGAA